MSHRVPLHLPLDKSQCKFCFNALTDFRHKNKEIIYNDFFYVLTSILLLWYWEISFSPRKRRIHLEQHGKPFRTLITELDGSSLC